jgi:hypothetical protein
MRRRRGGGVLGGEDWVMGTRWAVTSRFNHRLENPIPFNTLEYLPYAV